MSHTGVSISTTEQAAQAFSTQSALFDSLYAGNNIIQYKRLRVRTHVLRYWPTGGHMLELNAGTGEDAIYFAQHGLRIHATDISTGMQEVLKKKVMEKQLQHRITPELCSYTELRRLQHKGPFDGIFSNFAGLNCTNQLDKVLSDFSPLLKPGGIVTLVVLPPFCLWETALLFRAKFKTAFRRFCGSKGARAHIEGHYFTCWYYRPSYIKKVMQRDYDLLGQEGLCTIVPPSYIEHFAENHPRLYRLLRKKEDQWKSKWPWKNVGDYYIISFRKKEAP